MEVYCITQDIEFVINSICEIKDICPRTVIKKCSYIYAGIDCVKHLFRVISGLESMILGETEIVAQIKLAYKIAKEHSMVGAHLSGLFQMALSVEKDVRNTTDINNSSISMGKAVLNLVAINMPSLDSERILFVGSGQMMKKIAPHFKNVNCGGRMVINRGVDNAQKLALLIDAEFTTLDNLSSVIDDYSVIIACCYSKTILLNVDLFHTQIKNQKPLLIVDLSMPLVTDLTLRQYNNISVITVDDIAKMVDVGIEKRQIAATSADIIIAEKLTEYLNWEKKRWLSPLIKALRDNAELIRNDVLSQAQKQLQNGAPVDTVLTELSVKLTNKLLHAPTVNLCATSINDSHDDLMGLVSSLYNLEMKVE